MTFIDVYVADPEARPFDWNTLPAAVTDHLPEPLSWARGDVIESAEKIEFAGWMQT